MCDPLTLIAGASAIFGGISSLMQPGAPAPPAAENPAIAAPTARAPGATVRLGIGQDDETSATTNNNLDGTFVEKRARANSLGNLGRSGLSL